MVSPSTKMHVIVFVKKNAQIISGLIKKVVHVNVKKNVLRISG